MEDFWPVLSGCPLFKGIDVEEIKALLGCLGGKKMDVSKGEPVFLEGDAPGLVGVLLSGSVQIVQDDYYGNRSVLSMLSPGEIFGEAFSCAGLDALPVSVIALRDSSLLLVDSRRALDMCSNACRFHSLLIGNLLRELAEKNLAFTKKIRYMSQKTTRDKLMAYLLDQAKERGRGEFVIPFDRQSLADYLGVERSAMSAEIGKLKRAGILDTKASWFCLKQLGQDYKTGHRKK